MTGGSETPMEDVALADAVEMVEGEVSKANDDGDGVNPNIDDGQRGKSAPAKGKGKGKKGKGKHN